MGGKSKTKTKTDNTIDPWSKSQYEQGTSRVRGLLDDNPFQSYGGERVAGLSDFESQAMGDYNANTGVARGLLDRASATADGAYANGPSSVTTGQVAGADLSPYLNPHTDIVVDRTIADMNRAREMTISDTEGSLHPSAFGGSRHGVADAITNERFIDQAGNTSAALRSDGFDRAMDLLSGDIDRNFKADYANADLRQLHDQGLLGKAGLEAGIAGQADDLFSRQAGMMSAMGANERGIKQAKLDAAYQEELRKQDDYYRRLSAEAGLLGATPIITDSTSTGTQTQNPGALGIIGTLAQSGGALMSGFGSMRNG